MKLKYQLHISQSGVRVLISVKSASREFCLLIAQQYRISLILPWVQKSNQFYNVVIIKHNFSRGSKPPLFLFSGYHTTKTNTSVDHLALLTQLV